MNKAAPLKKSVSTKIKVSQLPSFDTAEFLKTDEDIALYISLVIEEGDAGELAHALGVAARARGMSGIAKPAASAAKPSTKPCAPAAHQGLIRSTACVRL